MTIHTGHMPLRSPNVGAEGVSSFAAYHARNRAERLSGLRWRAEAAIERLIAILDAIDGDPDFEPDSDGEPWLAIAIGGGHGCGDDREEDALEWVHL